jgi:type VI protein secretion system component VasK
MSDYRETERLRAGPRRGGGFGRGLLLGALLVALGLVYFAYDRGSFERAGADADRAAQHAVAEAQQSLGQAAERTGESLQRAGEQVERSPELSPDRTRN